METAYRVDSRLGLCGWNEMQKGSREKGKDGVMGARRSHGGAELVGQTGRLNKTSSLGGWRLGLQRFAVRILLHACCVDECIEWLCMTVCHLYSH